jgi:predicted MFS family arabinose efflux permease
MPVRTLPETRSAGDSLVVVSIGAFTPFVHFVPYAEDRGLAHGSAVAMLSLFGVGSTPGRFMLGNLADRIGRRRSVVAMFAGMATMQLWWLVAVATWEIATFALLFGIFYGGYVALYGAGRVTFPPFSGKSSDRQRSYLSSHTSSIRQPL